jgi:hypothetical protein
LKKRKSAPKKKKANATTAAKATTATAAPFNTADETTHITDTDTATTADTGTAATADDATPGTGSDAATTADTSAAAVMTIPEASATATEKMQVDGEPRKRTCTQLTLVTHYKYRSGSDSFTAVSFWLRTTYWLCTSLPKAISVSMLYANAL